jgi:DNA polymerase-1
VSGPLGLPFDEIWLIDFEFLAPDGERPDVVCMVARELATGRLLRLWHDQLGTEPPFRTDDRVLFVGFMLAAEWSCFLELGWPIPSISIDLYLEYRVEMNGLQTPTGRGLLGALSHHGLASITKQEKDEWRERIMAGPPFTKPEVVGILDYCQSDVDPLGSLLERMLPAMRSRHLGIGRAIFRSRYMAAVARMERFGIPIDTVMLDELTDRWDDIRLDLIAQVDADYGVYEGTTFKMARFADYLKAEGIAWPRVDDNPRALKVDSDTFGDMAKIYPQLQPLKELRTSLGEMKLNSITVGADSRNRTGLWAFSTKTSRNAPSNSKFIFGPAKWTRCLITPEPGTGLAYIDWSAQEVHIGARLSQDPAMIAAVESGDPYLSFAKMAGLAPAEATKQTHGAIRDRCKTVVLGTGYGMGKHTLAYRIGGHVLEAAELLRRIKHTWPVYFEWCRDNQARAQLTGRMETVYGWPLNVTEMQKPNSLLNFPMQANGAEMLRVACMLATEAGISVCAPVHDAVLIEAPLDELDATIAETIAHMEAAAIAVIGAVVPANVEQVIRPGQRFSDARAEVMWNTVVGLLERRRVA